jgi:cutinase
MVINELRGKAFSRRLVAGVGTVGAAVASLLVTAAPPASADACPAVEVLFARGTGEPTGVGRVGQGMVDALRPLIGNKSIAVDAVDYPASYDFLRATDGANDASVRVQNIAVTCPDTKIVLGGYSQGAAVVDLVTSGGQSIFGFANPMPADMANHVAAVAVFGNPANRIGGPSPTANPLYADKTIDLCNGADPVCSPGGDVAAHRVYVEAGLADQAAHFVAQRLSGAAPQGTAVISSASATDPSELPTP